MVIIFGRILDFINHSHFILVTLIILKVDDIYAVCITQSSSRLFFVAEFDHQVHKSGAKAIVTVPELVPMLLKVAAKNNIPQENIFLFGDKAVNGIQPFKSISSTDKACEVSTPIKEIQAADDLAFICFSSGTTGVAKGVMLTHRNFVSQMIMVTDFEETDPNKLDDVYIGFLPFFHIFGLTALVLRAFYSNTPVVVIARYELELVCRLIEKYKITMGPIVPPVGKFYYTYAKKKRGFSLDTME
jgi:4-coumarate--CoA ligase